MGVGAGCGGDACRADRVRRLDARRERLAGRVHFGHVHHVGGAEVRRLGREVAGMAERMRSTVPADIEPRFSLLVAGASETVALLDAAAGRATGVVQGYERFDRVLAAK
jgi:hypothetical protein